MLSTKLNHLAARTFLSQDHANLCCCGNSCCCVVVFIIERIVQCLLKVVNVLLQSESAIMILPELEFEAESGGLSGRFTTVEGLLASMKTQVFTDKTYKCGKTLIYNSFHGSFKGK